MKRAYLVLILCFPLLLFSDLKDPHVFAVTEGEPAWNLCRSVNAITGDLFISSDDLVIDGVQPIHLSRHYISGDGKGYNGGWEFMPHLHLTYTTGNEDDRNRIYVAEPNSSPMCYRQHRSKASTYAVHIEENGDGITNCGKGIISARTNIRNQTIERFSKHKLLMRGADGTHRLYVADKSLKLDEVKSRRFALFLEWEHHPNGNWTCYEYDKEHRIKSIRTLSPSLKKTYAWAKFHYDGKSLKTHDFHVDTSDGRRIHYRFSQLGKQEKHFYLTHVTSAHLPEESEDYCSAHARRGPLVQRRNFPDGRALHAHYYELGKNQVGSEYIKVHDADDPVCDRVRTLAFPVGNGPTPVETHRFFYSVEKHKEKGKAREYRYSGCTRVYDIEDNLTNFHFTPESRPQSIEYYQRKNGAQALSYSVQYAWQHATDLHTKTQLDGNGKLIQSRSFSYDDRGNVAVETLSGNLIGVPNSTDSYTIKYAYTDNNLVSRKEEQDGTVTLFTYLPGTDLPTSRLMGDLNKIYFREFCIYDQDNILIQTIKDNGSSPNKDDLTGVTQRMIQEVRPKNSAPALGMPEVIEERYLDLQTGQEKLLKKIVLSYSSTAKVTKQEIYDAEGICRYNLSTTYNICDLPETQTNPLGHTQITQYDAVGNPVIIQKPAEALTLFNRYDCCNRLVETTEQSPTGASRTTRHTYDGKHNCTSTTDPSGNTTRFTHDAFGNILTTELPPLIDERGTTHCPILFKTYNALNQETSTTDPAGHKTEKLYTIRNAPSLIIHPDGTQETHEYHLNGTLKKSIDQEGTTTLYSYDVFKNVTSKKVYSPSNQLLSEETFVYDAFHLLSHTDPEGNTTYFTYDGAGRKIQETLSSSQGTEQTTYTYDPLGRLHSTCIGEILHLSEYDLLDRIIEEREEDQQGNILTKIQYGYDAAGNKTTVTQFTALGPATETTQYDSFKRPIQIEDPLGFVTTIAYEDRFYNASGHAVMRKTITDPQHIKTIETYDTHGNVASVEKLDPNGKRIAYEERYYDLNDNLCCKRSHIMIDNSTTGIITTAWEYGYQKRLLCLIEAVSAPEERITTYAYTPKGLLATLFKPDGTALEHTYDPLGRLSTLSSSDNTIFYLYHYNKLNQIEAVEDRINSSTIYRTYDPKGRLLSETFPGGIILSSHYNTSGQRTQLTLPDQSSITYSYHGTLLTQIDRYNPSGYHLYTHKYLAYDQSGHLLRQQLINNQEMTLSYDLLLRPTSSLSTHFDQQITSYSPTGAILQTLTNETTHHYTYDPLNQLIEEPQHTYSYDSHGNRLSKDQATYAHNHLHQIDDLIYNSNGALIQTKDAYYTYDALDRLLSIQTPTTHYTFTYDAWHRRLSETHDHQTQYFLYDDQNEIGAYTNGNLTQLRILGIGLGAEIGAAIAIELDNTLLTPIHDLFGNLVLLLDNSPVASYTYTAFGEQSTETTLENPWGFSSKRHVHDLVYFGRRYYSPQLGRWLTTDPAGYTQGPNLYTYLLNTPLNKVDLYGLFPLTPYGQKLYHNVKDLSLYLSNGNSLADYHYYNEGPSNFTLNSNDTRPKGMVILVNGINTTWKEHVARVDAISETFGIPCHGVYNPTHGVGFDLIKCALSIKRLPGVRNDTVGSLHELCVSAPDHMKLIIAHSKGCLDTCRMLEGMSERHRQNIEVAAFAPAVVIPKRLASFVNNYASKGADFVVLRDYIGVFRGIFEGNIQFLPRGAGAPLIGDHSFESPTFKMQKDTILKKFTQENNCNTSWQNTR